MSLEPPAEASRCRRHASICSRLAHSSTRRVLIRLPSGSRSSRRSMSVSRRSPDRTTLRIVRESKRVLDRHRSSLSTAEVISWASSTKSTGRSSVVSRCASQRSRRALKPTQRNMKRVKHNPLREKKIAEAELRRFQEPYDRLKAELTVLGYVCHGTITRTYLPC